MDLFNLSGKKAIITGASGGLGRGMAEGFHQAGAEVAIIAKSDNVFKAAQEMGSLGPNVYAVKGDLGNRLELERAFNEALNLLGGTVDILVNNAGIQRRHKSEEFPVSDWDDVIKINLDAVFLLCQMAGKIMIKKGKGKIINVASMTSFFGGYTVPAYAASKGGVAQLTKALSNEWAVQGINVNSIAPGYMATEMNTALINNSIKNEKILARIPAGRWGLPEDLKGTVIYLASDASNYVNGAVIPVDGGYLGC